MTPTSLLSSPVLPSEPYTYLFWGFLPPPTLQTIVPASFGYFFSHPNPCTCLRKCSSTFPVVPRRDLKPSPFPVVPRRDLQPDNYLSWSASVEIWFMGQGYEDHLITQEADIPELDKFFLVLTLIGLRPDLEPVRDQILGSSSVPSLDDVFARLLRISTQTLPFDSTSDSSVLVFQTNSRGGRSSTQGRGQRPHCTYCNKLGHTRDRCYQLHGRPPRIAHVAQSSDSPLPQPPSSSASQASVAQPGNASACLTHTSSLGPWILDSGASDQYLVLVWPFLCLLYLSLLSFILLNDWSTGKTIGIGRESQGLYHLTSDSSPAVCISTDAPLLIHNRLGHPSLSKFQKMVPRFSHFVVASVDNAREYFSAPFTSFMSHHGILHQSSCAHTPQQNGTLFFTACYLINRMPSSVLHDQIPHSLLFPDQLLYFLPPHVFGCTCFVHILTPGQDKLSVKAMKCLFLGYSRLQRGYRCYSLETHRYFISADVTFFEDSPFFSTTSESFPVSEVLPIPIVFPPDAMPPRPLQTKDLGKLKYFLGIEIAQSSSGVVLSQRKYALDILEETGMLDCKPVDTPMDPNVKLVPGQGEPLGDPGRYRRLVGKLNYLTITRPDISFPVSVVSQFLQSPCDSHWDAVIRILRYIKSTPSQGVLYENRGHTQVVGYTDADWAGSPTDRRSTSGYCVFIGGNLISWKSKKQDVVARSSAEVEYRAMALATCELIWLRHLLRELRFGKDEQMKLICDNQAALHIASNPVFHERTKHIEVDCYFIREKIASGCVATSFVNSNDQLADIFTKSLRGPRIKYICNKLGAYDVYAPA
ncbi:Retrovirus-related Pol polyprotein from transposon RE2 [Vitis vinifera]|uniref:Retrovirus-related Pol polyprotein from transposon RE2 n=1 Tax=Vitis vinifera TaxID=29760 RepID=A0A438HZB9_VITVI|nr:Retrovirus-related Pol polyprotein from transposon RE2 [Vitis vinifera]